MSKTLEEYRREINQLTQTYLHTINEPLKKLVSQPAVFSGNAEFDDNKRFVNATILLNERVIFHTTDFFELRNLFSEFAIFSKGLNIIRNNLVSSDIEKQINQN